MKKRILLVNKFYYRRGGDCVYTLALERLLLSHGHDVAVWSMSHSLNLQSDYASLFAPGVGFDGPWRGRLQAMARTLGYAGAKRSFAVMLDAFRPDVVHLNNIHSYLSPVIAEVAARRGIKTVWTLHDYKLVCPSYSCLCRGEICESCFADRTAVMRRRCMKGSLVASAAAFIEALKWNRQRLTESVDRFICPSRFMYTKMLGCGFPADKLAVINNFVPYDAAAMLPVCDDAAREDYCCYVGRLSPEKGVVRLLEVLSRMDLRLHLIGDGPLADALRGRYASCGNIRFLGNCDAAEVARQLSHAKFSVMPSEWYENCPLSVIESLCAGTPVVGAKIGGIPELIDDGDGLCFNPGDETALSAAVMEASSRHWNYDAIGRRAFSRFSAQRHYNSLTDIY